MKSVSISLTDLHGKVREEERAALGAELRPADWCRAAFHALDPVWNTLRPLRERARLWQQAHAGRADQLQSRQQAERRCARLEQFLADPLARIVLPKSSSPTITVLILSYNRADQLLECLESLRDCTDDVDYQLVVVDNASTDRAPEVLERLVNARVIRCWDNLGFVRGNNLGADEIHSPVMVLLNNDTILTPGWARSMLSTLQTDPRAGAVGPQLVFPDGRLQEAGCVIYRDGRVKQVGMFEDALCDPYQHVREVDYSSGACLMVRTQLFHRLGGFDDRFAPCYYEDADLCMGIESLGFSTVYQPAARVIHHGPSGRGVHRAAAHCARNRNIFLAKWNELLDQRPTISRPEDILLARDRRPGRRILLIGDSADATALAGQQSVVTMIDSGRVAPSEIKMLRNLGVEVLRVSGGQKLSDLLASRRGCFHQIVLRDVEPEIERLTRRRLPLTPVTVLSSNESLPDTRAA